MQTLHFQHKAGFGGSFYSNQKEVILFWSRYYRDQRVTWSSFAGGGGRKCSKDFLDKLHRYDKDMEMEWWSDGYFRLIRMSPDRTHYIVVDKIDWEPIVSDVDKLRRNDFWNKYGDDVKAAYFALRNQMEKDDAAKEKKEFNEKLEKTDDIMDEVWTKASTPGELHKTHSIPGMNPGERYGVTNGDYN